MRLDTHGCFKSFSHMYRGKVKVTIFFCCEHRRKGGKVVIKAVSLCAVLLTGLLLCVSTLSLPPLPPLNQKQHQSNQNGNVRHEWGPSPLLHLLLLLHKLCGLFLLSMLERGGGSPSYYLKMEASTTKVREEEEEWGRNTTDTQTGALDG